MLAPNYSLVASSMLFLIPSTIASIKQLWVGYAIGLYMGIVSSLYHATKLHSLYWLDQLACFLYTVWAIYSCKMKGSDALWIIPFIFCSIIYYGGYVTQTMIWDEDLRISTIWHISMHVVSVVITVVALVS